jgi:hypothetical protein
LFACFPKWNGSETGVALESARGTAQETAGDQAGLGGVN